MHAGNVQEQSVLSKLVSEVRGLNPSFDAAEIMFINTESASLVQLTDSIELNARKNQPKDGERMKRRKLHERRLVRVGL